MSRDGDRIDDSAHYLNRRSDQRAFENDLAARSSEVWDAILDHDHGRTRWALGIPPPDPSAVHTDLPVSAAEQLFGRYRARLLAMLEYGVPEYPVGLPRDIARAWARTLGLLSFADPPGQTVRAVTAVEVEVGCVRVAVARGHGDPDPSFGRGMLALERGLTGLRQVVLHVGFPDLWALPAGPDE